MKQDGFRKFLDAARQGRPEPKPEPPFGFATHIAARAFSPEEDRLAIWERLARIGAVAAIAICVLTTVLHHRAPRSSALADFAGIEPSNESLW
jgi:hypothetical protein